MHVCVINSLCVRALVYVHIVIILKWVMFVGFSYGGKNSPKFVNFNISMIFEGFNNVALFLPYF